MRVHFIEDTEVPCGKHSAPDRTRHPADVTCKPCQQWLRKQQAYRDGWNAAYEESPSTTNPHPFGVLRAEWAEGHRNGSTYARPQQTRQEPR